MSNADDTGRGWSVTLWCNRCQKNIGRLLAITTYRPDDTERIRDTMREHDVNVHEGRS